MRKIVAQLAVVIAIVAAIAAVVVFWGKAIGTAIVFVLVAGSLIWGAVCAGAAVIGAAIAVGAVLWELAGGVVSGVGRRLPKPKAEPPASMPKATALRID